MCTSTDRSVGTGQQNRLMENKTGIQITRIQQLWPYFRQAMVLFLSSFCIILLTSQISTSERLSGKYLGQEPPGNIPVRFAENIIPDDLHSVPVFSFDGKTIYYKDMEHDGIMFISESNRGWEIPRPLFVSGKPGNSDDPCLHPDGDRFFFSSYDKADNREYIYFCKNDGNTFSEPKKPAGLLNKLDLHWQFSIAENGNIYFSANGSIYFSVYEGGKYNEPEKLDSTINSLLSECTPYISPDEQLLIFARANGSNPDLYISYRNSNGTWQEAKILGPGINTEHHEMCPRITPDGKYLFFISSREGLFSAYWVDVSVLGTGF